MVKDRMNGKSERDTFAQKAQEIATRAETRKGATSGDFGVDWQVCLELPLLMMEQPFLDHPGELLPMQIDGHEEWDFYVEIEIKLDLPPDTSTECLRPVSTKNHTLGRLLFERAIG